MSPAGGPDPRSLSLSFLLHLTTEIHSKNKLFKVKLFKKKLCISESGQPEVPLDREFMANELNVAEDSSAKAV